MKENFQVDLRGIVQILSHHLYSSPRVYLRELIQNARDAIHARTLMDPNAPRSVEIVVDEARGELTVTDTGIGLAAEEMRTLLATIGASSKRNEFEAARADFLGQFGIGLLSCFLVAEQIEVTSRSAKENDAPTMRWVGHSDGTYSVTPAPLPLDEPGTTVRLVARPDDREWVGLERVRLLATRFASLLDLPIRLSGASTDAEATPERQRGALVSRRPAPWASDERAAAQWCQEEFGFEPEVQFPLDVPLAGVRGVAFVAPDRGRVGSRRGDAVFCRGMFLSAENVQLAPAWATFVRLGIECGELAPTASRESLQETPLLARVNEQIGEQIRAGIEALATSDPEAFEEMMHVHGEALRSIAVEDEAMLDFVIRYAGWDTTAGYMTLEELGESGVPASYVTSAGDYAALAPLAKAAGQILINGSFVNDREVLERVDDLWASRRHRLRRFELERVVDGLPKPAPTEASLAEAVLAVVAPRLEAHGVTAEVRSFEPASLPVLFAPDRRSAPQHKAAAPVAADPWGDLLSGLGDIGTGIMSKPVGPRLILNLAAPAVRELAGGLEAARADSAVDVLRVLGLLFSRQTLADADTAALADAVGQLIRMPGQTAPPAADNAGKDRS